jgi:uncharacterized protein YdeI (YjbR/CyaY-like superfamily)
MFGAFKNHCSFSLYKAAYMTDNEIAESVKAGKKFGFMDKLKDVSVLPARRILVSYIHEVMANTEKGTKKEIPISDKPKVLETPYYFSAVLNSNQDAKSVWKEKSDAFQKDYLIWIMDAKTEVTRQKRMEQSLEWIVEGKGRFWQYTKK